MHGIILLKRGVVLNMSHPSSTSGGLCLWWHPTRKAMGEDSLCAKRFGLFGVFISYNRKHFHPEEPNAVLIHFYCWVENTCVHYCSFWVLPCVTAFLETCVQLVLNHRPSWISYASAAGYSPEAHTDKILRSSLWYQDLHTCSLGNLCKSLYCNLLCVRVLSPLLKISPVGILFSFCRRKE